MSGVRDTDRGYQRIRINLGVSSGGVRLAKHNKLSVGIHKDDGTATYPNGATVGEVATAHEFGVRVPQRSWLRGWFDGRSQASFKAELLEVGMAAIEGTRPMHVGLAELGDVYTKEIRSRIDAHIDPVLANATVRKKTLKGSATPDVPLEDTHLFINTIRSRVEIK